MLKYIKEKNQIRYLINDYESENKNDISTAVGFFSS